MPVPHVSISDTKASMIDRLASEDAERRRIEILAQQLTPRQRQVAFLIAQGLPNSKIAKRLGISVHTAKFHVDSLLTLVDVDRRAGIAAFAVRVGLA